MYCMTTFNRLARLNILSICMIAFLVLTISAYVIAFQYRVTVINTTIILPVNSLLKVAQDRYHLPLDPFIAMFAAYAIAQTFKLNSSSNTLRTPPL